MKTQRIPTSLSSRPALPVSPPDQTGPRTDERQHHQEHHAEHHEAHRMQSICSSATRSISSPIRSAECSGIRVQHLGSGTILDTARLRARLRVLPDQPAERTRPRSGRARRQLLRAVVRCEHLQHSGKRIPRRLWKTPTAC